MRDEAGVRRCKGALLCEKTSADRAKWWSHRKAVKNKLLEARPVMV